MAVLSAQGRSLVLDSGGVTALAEGNVTVRAAVVRARRDGWSVVIAAPVLAEVHTGRRDHAHIDRAVNAVETVLPTTATRTRQAGELRARSRVLDVVDAIVVAEAIEAQPAVIVTSDPDDIGRLVDAAGGRSRIAIVPI